MIRQGVNGAKIRPTHDGVFHPARFLLDVCRAGLASRPEGPAALPRKSAAVWCFGISCRISPLGLSIAFYKAVAARYIALAAERGFGRVVGVEFSEQLCDQARRNLSQTAATVICGDAASYQIPPA